MIDKESDILILPEKDKTKRNLIIISHLKSLLITELPQKDESNTEKTKSRIEFPDEILSIHYLESLRKILLVCINNKTLYLLEESLFKNKAKLDSFNIENDTISCLSNKKITSVVVSKENEEKYFLLLSDKFGEISLKPVSNKETKESFAREIKILCGHCDTISFIKKSLNSKLFLSSDSFGKIKIYEFPNLFNVLSLILYKENEVNYANFVGELDKCILVLNQNKFIDLWSTYDFVFKSRFNLDFIKEDEKIKFGKMINNNKNFLLGTEQNIFVFDIELNQFKVSLNKKIMAVNDLVKTSFKFTEFNDEIISVSIDEGFDILKIEKI